MISDAAVEAAADMIVQGDRGACECRRSIFDKHDVNPPCSTRRQAIRTARAALEAAAPHLHAPPRRRDPDLIPYLMAKAWDEGEKAGMDFQVKLGRFLEYDGPEPEPFPNPYRSQS